MCFGSVWGVNHAFLCMVFFAAVLLLCSVFFSFQDLTTAEDEERTPDLDLERISGGAGWRVTWRLQPGEVGLFWRLFFLGVLLGLLLCPRACLRLLRTRSLSAFFALSPSTRLLAQALGVALLGFALGFGCLGFGWEGSLCLCRFFLPLFVSLPLRCSAQALGFGFLGFAFALVCFGSVWGVNHAFLCMVFFRCCSVVVLSFLFFSGSDDSRGRGEDTRPGSGAAQWRGWLEGHLASSTR